VATRPVLAYGGGCAGDEPACEYSRHRDGYELRLLDTLPDGHDRIPLVADALGAFSCLRGPRACPPCPEATWVVLADVAIEGERVGVQCFPHRRYAAGFAELRYRCAPAEVGGVDKTQKVAFAPVGSTVLADAVAGEASDPARASVAVRLPLAGLRTLPVHFDVRRGETYRDLLERERAHVHRRHRRGVHPRRRLRRRRRRPDRDRRGRGRCAAPARGARPASGRPARDAAGVR
jgi:hypothetical protein